MSLITRRAATPPVVRQRTSKNCFVAIDIGCYSVKVMQLESTGRHHRVRFHRNVPHAQPLNPADPEACLDQIEQTLDRAWSSRRVWLPIPTACTLSMSLLEFRSQILPIRAEDLTQEAIDDSFDSDAETLAGSWMVSGWPVSLPRAGQPGCSVALLGVREEFAAAISARLWKCGLDCHIIDGPPFVMSRAIGSAAGSPAAAVLDWGYGAITLTVAIEGSPRFTRVLRQCGLDTLITAVTQSLHVDATQARHLLENYGLCAHKAGDAANDLETLLAELGTPYLTRLTDELHRTWNFVRQLPDQHPQRLVLMGGGAMLLHAREAVQDAIPVPVEIWLPPPATEVESSEKLSPLFGPALALARLPR